MGELIIAALATYAVSVLITEYGGIGKVFYKLRSRYADSAFNCSVCLSFWVSFIMFAIVLCGFGYYLSPLAFIGVVILLERL